MGEDDRGVKSGLIRTSVPHFTGLGWEKEAPPIRKLDLRGQGVKSHKTRWIQVHKTQIWPDLYPSVLWCACKFKVIHAVPSLTRMAILVGSWTFLRAASTWTERAREDTNLMKSSRLHSWGSSSSASHSLTPRISLTGRSQQNWACVE